MRRIGFALFALLLGVLVAVPHGTSAQTGQSGFPDGAEVVVAVDVANVRRAPGLDSEITGELFGGMALTIAGEPEYADGFTWYQVQPRNPDITSASSGAWVAGDFLAYE